MGLEYIQLAPGFVKEVVETYESWDRKEPVPMKIQELMMVLRIEVTKLYDPGSWARQAEMPKVPVLRDTRLGRRICLEVCDLASSRLQAMFGHEFA